MNQVKAKVSEDSLENIVIENPAVKSGFRGIVVVTTEDKLKICLMENFKLIEDRKNWVAPFGIFLTIVTVLVTSDFRDTFGLSKDSWFSFFLFGAILSAAATLSSLYKMKKVKSVDEIVEEIKSTSFKKQKR